MTQRSLANRHPEVASRLALRIKEGREAMGLSQMRMANELELDHTAVSRMESGNRSPSLGLLVEMSRRYGWSIDRMLGTGGDTAMRPEEV